MSDICRKSLSLTHLIFLCFRLKALEEEQYTQKEADAAAGLGTYKPTTKKKVLTQEVSEDVGMKDTKEWEDILESQEAIYKQCSF